ncbi:MAG: small ribosomal subunit biogenesis GTPase RsgA [Candidatus Endonucleobacter bathymodioli]|uniref:Small ribosomal subunit biogenesis GTPase RsgA n=1 Tax=Candidatus Endonucleibacter bathymodioli TaxID=539814 RepID=A0AA90SY92_9GAMM|nr:small ribosomal subunit biogenesis GTPase RsgA [Candidatus Endonucleobacter bathymodioli]
MTKRNLTRRQNWRIQKIQDERIERAQKQEVKIEQQFDDGDLGPEQLGLIISHYGAQLDIESVESVESLGGVWRCHLRANLPPLVTGDRVVWRASVKDRSGVVVALVDRKSILSRPDQRGKVKPVAANIDYIVLVIASLPTPYTNLIDRYLVAAETVNIEPVILLNKIDLLTDPECKTSLNDMLKTYKQIGYTVLTGSTVSSNGLTSLQVLLSGNTSVFVGQSGVGKSSLVNALLPGIDVRVGALSGVTGKGAHTTTTAKLYHFPTGGTLIDSPGIREFGLWHMTQNEIIEGFREFRPFLGYCRFRNCSHKKEPGCAICQALEEGNISPERINSYWQIIGSL